MSATDEHNQEQERVMKQVETKLERATRFDVISKKTEFSIINETIAEVLTELSNEALSGDVLDHDKYLVTRAKIDGIRMLQSRFARIVAEGKEAQRQLDGTD